MKNGRIIVKITLKNESPLSIGSGRADRSDRDIVTTLYPISESGEILPVENITAEGIRKHELPFIPASSFLGKLFNAFNEVTQIELKKYWGDSENRASFLDCGDLLLTQLSYPTENRDGIRIDSEKGTVAKGAKFDYEVLPTGSIFETILIIRAEEYKDEKNNLEEILTDYTSALKLASTMKEIVETGIYLGAKITNGYGLLKGSAEIFELDFDNDDEFDNWINNNLFLNSIEPVISTYKPDKETDFEILASFSIKNSLIIRSYSKDPKMPDSTHLKSGGRNILSGSSIKGALRGRAQRILNTVQSEADPNVTSIVLAGLFGDVEKEPDEVTVKKDGYTVPSRVFVDEISIEEVTEEIQTRIQIDRFTGGTIEGALIEEMPIFPIKDKEHLKNFRIKVKNATDTDKGLILLLLKDLWTADLPIGGEKSIGRGVLTGLRATVFDGEQIYTLLDDFSDPDKAKVLQGYVDELNKLNNFSFYANRVNKYKIKKYGTERT